MRKPYRTGASWIAPCKGCAEREPGCHSSCAGYAEYRKLIDEERTRYRKEHNLPLYGYARNGK